MPFAIGDRLGRYEIVGNLGAGGFGVVFEALEVEHGEKVAVKVLKTSDPEHVYRFKREFRALADIRHPNLVSLYELALEAGQWYFAMELVEGVDFMSYVRDDARDSADSNSPVDSGNVFEAETLDLPEAPGERSGAFLANEIRLRSALVQLTQGVMYLHEKDKIHGDLKPANVLVTHDGRTVLLDFGLVRDFRIGEFGVDTLGSGFAGTSLYMAPEQLGSGTVDQASDWYSVGVMLYEALAGRPPVRCRNVMELAAQRLSTMPRPPSEFMRDVPDDLNALCMELLEISSRRRPAGQEVLAKLRVAAPGAETEREDLHCDLGREPVFVGRGFHLEILEQAFLDSRKGRAIAVFVNGRSGMGKTILVQKFLQQLSNRQSVVVIQGNCYQQEAVPYKAFDGVVDSLTRFLRRLSDREAALLAPRNSKDLVRLFPVLARVGVLEELSRQGPHIRDPQEVRRRAFFALKELLARLGDRFSPVLFVDDLQWGDVESALLLRHLLWGESQPSVLFIGCCRSDEMATGAMLRELLDTDTLVGEGIRQLEVSELPQEESLKLAERLLSRKGIGKTLAAAVAKESNGVPFLVAELARFLLDRDGDSHELPDKYVRLDQLLRWRASKLPEDSRRLLEVASVAARPTPVSVCMRAAGHHSDELKSLSILRTEHLIRIHQGETEEELAVYHDRIRESVVAALDPHSRRRYHLRLAQSWENVHGADPELLMGHFLEAGVNEKAEEYALQSADRAFESLAFDRAARLYRVVLELAGGDDSKRHELFVRLGDSLANASRGPEAAEVYLNAIEGQNAEEVLKLRHRAAYHLLASGHLKKGIRVAREVLNSVGMKLPKYNAFDLVLLALRRLRLMLRGVRYRERPVDQVAPRDLLKVDACFTVGMSMAIADPLVAMLDFSTRHTILALRCGEPYRVSLALSTEGATLAYLGLYRRACSVVAKGEEIARRIDDPFALGMAIFSYGVAEYWAAGNWKAADVRFAEAAEVFTNRCSGASIWLTLAQGLGLINLYYLGRIRELSRKHPILLNDARERRDRSAEFLIGESECHNIVYLAADDTEGAKAKVKPVFVPTGRENPFYNWHTLAHHVDSGLYSGGLHELGSVLPRLWSAASSCQAFRIPLTRNLSLLVYGRGLVGVGTSVEGEQRLALLRTAKRVARRLKRGSMSFSLPGSQIIRAGVESLAGSTAEASRLAAEASKGFDGADMPLHAAVCRRRHGELIGGGEGRAMVAQADSVMEQEGIKNPGRWANMIAPGKWLTAGV
jgi:serine/threonine protein kinase